MQFYPHGKVFYSGADNRFYKGGQTKTGFEASGLITPTDIEDVKATVVLDEIIGLARPQYNLTKIVRTVQMNKLVASIDTKTQVTGQEKVDPMVEAKIEGGDYSRANFDLWKNVTHVAVEESAQMKASHDIMGLEIEDAAGAIAYMKNKQIKEIAEACTEKVSGTVYSDWGAVTSGVSDTNPMIAINASMNYIRSQGYEPDYVAMHPTIYSKFITNTWVRDHVQAGLVTVTPQGTRYHLPGYPNVEIITDGRLTETPTASLGPLVGSRKAVMLGQGPISAAKYRNEVAGYDAYIIRDYMEPKLVIDAAIDKIAT